MNILIISQVFPPKRGGVQTAAYNTAKFLSKFGHEVVVVTSKWADERRKFHEMNGFLVYRFKSYNPPELKGITQVSSLRFNPLMLLKLPRIIRKHNIQLIHAQGRLFPISWLTAVMNKFVFKRPMFVNVQGRLEVGISGIIEDNNPTLIMRTSFAYVLTVINQGETQHRLYIDGFNVQTNLLFPGEQDTITIYPKEEGTYPYYESNNAYE